MAHTHKIQVSQDGKHGKCACQYEIEYDTKDTRNPPKIINPGNPDYVDSVAKTSSGVNKPGSWYHKHHQENKETIIRDCQDKPLIDILNTWHYLVRSLTKDLIEWGREDLVNKLNLRKQTDYKVKKVAQSFLPGPSKQPDKEKPVTLTADLSPSEHITLIIDMTAKDIIDLRPTPRAWLFEVVDTFKKFQHYIPKT